MLSVFVIPNEVHSIHRLGWDGQRLIDHPNAEECVA